MSLRTLRRLCVAALASTALLGGAAQAALYTTNYGSLVPGYHPNDDVTFEVTLPFAFNLFGGTYSNAVVSNNGNIQFGTNDGAYISSPLNEQTDFRGIAAFWSDLESRDDPLGEPGAGGSGVYMNVTNPNQVVFTWDLLGYYSHDYGGRVQFQLVLNNPAAVAAGEGVIGFFYGDMAGQATREDRTAAIGFGDGSGAINDGEVSVASGLSSAVAAQAQEMGHIWFNVNDAGEPEPNGELPEPASLALVGTALAGLALRRRRGLR